MDNSRICHCLLFHEHGKQNFVQPFRLSRKLLHYTHAWTKLHNEVMSWISGTVYMSVIMHGPYRERNYCAWFDGTVCEQPALVYHGLQLRFHRHGVNRNLFYYCVQIWNPFAQFKFLVYGHSQTYIHTYIHTHASSNAVTLVWDSLRLAPITAVWSSKMAHMTCIM